jgi:hypothetical protein
MNLQHKKVRLPIAALGVTALIAGAGALLTPAAFAAGQTLSILGADSNAASIVAVDPTVTAGAPVTFGVKVAGAAADTRKLVLEVLTAPVGGGLYVERQAGNAPPAANPTAVATTPATTTTNVAGATTITTTPALTTLTSLNGHAIKVGSDLAVVVSNAGSVLTLDRPLPNAHTATAILDLGATSGIDPFLPTGAGTTDEVYNYAGTTSVDNLYFGASTAGVYTFRLFRDLVSDGSYQANADDTTPTFTLTVKAPVDAFTLTAPATVDVGALGPKATVASTVSTTDIRGGSPATLATNLAAAMGLTITDNGVPGSGVFGENGSGTPTYDATNGFYRYLSTSATTALTQDTGVPHTLSTALTFASVAVGTAKTTEVVTNGVTGLTLAPKAGQEANVTGTGTGIKVRTGTSKVTYTSVASTSGTPQAGRTVTYTLTPGAGTTLADYSINGTPVATTGPTAGQALVTTDSNGVATIEVTSLKTANGNAYSLAATSGTGSANTTSTYTTAAAASIVITSTVAELTPSVTTSPVPIKGMLVDQYGEKFQPPSSDTQQVVVGGAATGNAVLTDGMFTYNYVPATPPVAGTTTTLTFQYNGGPIATATIQWASNTAAASIKMFTPADGAKAVTLQDNTTPNPAQNNAGTPAFGNTTGAVTGTVYDSSNAILAFKAVTLSGSDGVYFSSSATPDANHKLVTTLDVVTNNQGAITGAWVYFTKSGSATVTATSGTATAAATVTTDQPDDAQGFHIAVNDAVTEPGETAIITGKVDDIFGNPVPGVYVNLSTGTSTVGALGNTSVVTNSAGVFSTTFITGSGKSGEVEVEATIAGQTTNGVPPAAYATAGLTLTDGNYMDTATITVGAPASSELTIEAPVKVTAGAGGINVVLTGTSLPGSTVDIWAKTAGSVSYQLVEVATTDDSSNWTATVLIKKSTYFLARSGGLSTLSKQTQVFSKVYVTAKALGGGKVSLYGNGDPNAKAPMVFFRSISGVDPKLKGIITNSYGSARVTVSLPKGTRYVYATYQAAGTGKGQSPRIKVIVK